MFLCQLPGTIGCEDKIKENWDHEHEDKTARYFYFEGKDEEIPFKVRKNAIFDIVVKNSKEFKVEILDDEQLGKSFKNKSQKKFILS